MIILVATFTTKIRLTEFNPEHTVWVSQTFIASTVPVLWFTYSCNILFIFVSIQCCHHVASWSLENKPQKIVYCVIDSLRSHDAGLLVIPTMSYCRMWGGAFSYWAPLLWNQLPEADALSDFKDGLKTFLSDKKNWWLRLLYPAPCH